MSVISMTGIDKSYSDGKRRYDVLRGLDLTIEQGQSVAIVGPSGSGKTSILNIIAGLISPDRGTVQVLGQDNATRSEEGLSQLRARGIGYVFQAFHLMPQLSALENVALPMRIQGMPSSDSRARARSLLCEMGLADRIDTKPPRLSGGEQQRVAIARALVFDPPIILADEPTGSLDADTAGDVMRLLVSSASGRTLLLITHDRTIAASTTTRYALQHGRLTDLG